MLPYEDEIRSVEVGYAEAGLAGGLEIAFARKRGDGAEGTAPHIISQADQLPQEVENLPTPQVPATTGAPSWHLGFPGRVHDPAMRTSGSLGIYLLAALAAGYERHGENLRAEGLQTKLLAA